MFEVYVKVVLLGTTRILKDFPSSLYLAGLLQNIGLEQENMRKEKVGTLAISDGDQNKYLAPGV